MSIEIFTGYGPVIISAVSLVLSGWTYLHEKRKGETDTHYAARNHYMDILHELDRNLLERPELWAVYDNHRMAVGRSNAKRAVAQREAFIHMYLNLFETVYNDYREMQKSSPNADKFWKPWNAYITHFFTHSSEARAIFNRDASHKGESFFVKGFDGHVRKLLEEIEKSAAKLNTGSRREQIAGGTIAFRGIRAATKVTRGEAAAPRRNLSCGAASAA